MGARQSRRSVDITTTPKKDGLPAEGVVGDAAAPGDGKLEKIEEADAKPTTNGVALHTDATPEDKDKDKDEATEKEKENEKEDAPKVEEPKVESPTTETPAEGAAEVTTPTEGTPASPTSPESKETKKKDKSKKKWSFRSISFGKKDKNKPVREDAPKNGDVAKETLAEGGEAAEASDLTEVPEVPEASPTEKAATEQSEAVAEAPAAAVEAKAEEDKSPSAAAVVAPVAETAAAAVAASPAEEKKEEPSIPAPTPVPVEAKKTEEIEKEVEPANADKIVEVSPVQAVIEAPVEVNSQSKQIATTTTTTTTTTAPSIIEKKTSEDFPSQFPSSPPPTPIDPSPLQQAQQVAANASAIAEALKLPAEAANKANIANIIAASVKPASTTLSTSPTSSIRVDTSSTQATTEEPSKIPTSESPEQTGNAFPIPVTITTTTTTITTTIEAVQDIIEKPTEPQESDFPVTEMVFECESTGELEDTPLSDIPSVDPNIPLSDDLLERKRKLEERACELIPSILPPMMDTLLGMASENDRVIQTEEGPIPVSDDIVIEAKPAIVVPDSPVEDIKSVEIIMMAEKNCSDESLPEPAESTDELIVETTEKSQVPQILESPVIETNNEENSDKDVPPPLPASPVPVPKVTSQLLNFMSTQIEDSPIIDEIVNSTNVTILAEDIPCPLPPLVADIPEKKEEIESEIPELQTEEQTDTSCSLPPPEEIPEPLIEPLEDEDLPPVPQLIEEEISYQSLENVDNKENSAIIEAPVSLPEPLIEPLEDEDLPPVPQLIEEEISCQSLENVDNKENSAIIEAPVSPALSIPQIPIDTTLLTPPRSPSPTAAIKLDISTKESSRLELLDDSSNREFKTESIEDSLNSYNDSELQLKERLAETMEEENAPVSCQLSNAVQEKNDQSKIETIVENNVVANDIGTTENKDDAPKSPPPAVPAETLAPTLGPAITEDVASVTKAIEEIDINEKAVAAAVNENIESANTNEIIADMNHQNNMIE